MRKIILLIVFITLSGCASTTSKYDSHFSVSDKASKIESPELIEAYNAGTRAFNVKNFDKAFSEYEYAAYRGSTASALRLCVMYSYGIGTDIDALKALGWCKKVHSKGYKPAKKIIDHLYAKHWPEYQG